MCVCVRVCFHAFLAHIEGWRSKGSMDKPSDFFLGLGGEVGRLKLELARLATKAFRYVQEFAIKCEAQYDSRFHLRACALLGMMCACADSGSLVSRLRVRPLSYKCCLLMHTRSGTHYISRCKQLASWCDVLGLLHPSVFAATDEITTARQGTCSVLKSLAHFGSCWLDFLAAAVNIIEREGAEIGNAARVSGLKEQLNHIRASFAQRYTNSLAELLGVGGLVLSYARLQALKE